MRNIFSIILLLFFTCSVTAQETPNRFEMDTPGPDVCTEWNKTGMTKDYNVYLKQSNFKK